MHDGLRNGEHIRHGMYERFREVLKAQPVPWIEGGVEERLADAIDVLEPGALPDSRGA
ncbi:hypothetical protein CLV52_2194 [Amnibacterium kyonggiense]|uniref:Uncharacterized protein n=1 Tax=Amnibacterium kyonggiense TaxID=595671 RepID=A0A4R7FLJ1_9MICO|nr:hypothetical protein CLV52_2194 [Amnibacterium kyonggiense]